MHNKGMKTLILAAVVLGLISRAVSQTGPKSSTKAPTAVPSVLANASDGITKDQAEAIVTELRQIRQLLEKQQAQAARAAPSQPVAMPPPPERVQMSIGNGWYSIGRADAPVTLVEFADYQCTFCRRFHTDAFAELKKNYIETGKVRFISRDLPLEFHSYALKAAEATRCAGDQQKYWELRDALIANVSAWSDEVIQKAAAGLSLDMKGFQSCLDSKKYQAEVQRDAGDAATLQISGTPTFVLAKSAKDKLDGVRIVGAQPFITFQSAIEALLKD
jgi:protein-disulfide isomerase